MSSKNRRSLEIVINIILAVIVLSGIIRLIFNF